MSLQVSVLQQNLLPALQRVGMSAASRGGNNTVFSSVLLTARDGMLHLACHDSVSACHTAIGAMINIAGSALVPHSLLRELVAALPDDRVDLDCYDTEAEIAEAYPHEYHPESETQPAFLPANTLRIRCARSDAKLNSLNPADFAAIPEPGPNAVRISIPSDEFRRAVDMTIGFSAATPEGRPVLNGLNFQTKTNLIEVVGTDGFRLAEYKIILPETDLPEANLNLPRNTIQNIARLASRQAEPVVIEYDPDSNRATFRLTDAVINASLTTGAFPEHQQLIPDRCEEILTINTKDFAEALKNPNVFAKEGSKIVRFVTKEIAAAQNADGDGNAIALAMSAQSEEIGGSVAEITASRERDQDVRIAFNSSFVADAVSAISSEFFTMGWNDHSSPGVFRMADNEQYTAVIMPMYVQW